MPFNKSSTRRPAVVPPFLAWTIITACIASLFATCLYNPRPTRETARRAVDSVNLRQIGQASLLYASDNQDRLPQVDDLHAFATELARKGGLNDATCWIAGSESEGAAHTRLSTVLTADRHSVEPAFAAVRSSFAAVVRGLRIDHPATTPIAWTRGLQPDGTWSKDSPYGGAGGHILFLNGDVRFFRKLKSDSLFRFDAQGSTADIRAALPPDAVIANN